MGEVLIAEEAPFMRRLLRTILADEHTVVDAVANGVEAVEAYEAADPDLVVLSANLPIRDGIETTEAITDANPDAAVVVCSTERGASAIREATEAGAGAYLTKPFGERGLAEAIQTAMAS